MLLLAGGGVAGVRLLQGRVEAQSMDAAPATAHLVADLPLSPVVDTGFAQGRPLPPAESAELDAHLSALSARSRVVGLELWSWQGTLLYADPGHPAEETHMPADEIVRSHEGATWLKSGEESSRDLPTFEVFIPFDDDEDDDYEAIIEVLVPQDTITSQVRRSTRLVEGLGVAFLVLVLGVSGVVRHRLVRRER